MPSDAMTNPTSILPRTSWPVPPSRRNAQKQATTGSAYPRSPVSPRVPTRRNRPNGPAASSHIPRIDKTARMTRNTPRTSAPRGDRWRTILDLAFRMGRAPARLPLPEERRDAVRLEALAFVLERDFFLVAIALLQRHQDPMARFFQDGLGWFLDHPAIDDVRSGQDVARVRVHSDHDHNDPVAGQLAPVSQHHLSDVADPQAVDEGHPGRDAYAPAKRGADLYRVAVLADQDAVHGERRHLAHHARLARDVGVPEDRILICEDGDTVEIGSALRRGERVTAGMTFVDGVGIGDVGEVVLRDRRKLAGDGIVVVVVTVDAHSGDVLAGPDIIDRGVVEEPAEAILDEA